jgi:hypothetical protein
VEDCKQSQIRVSVVPLAVHEDDKVVADKLIKIPPDRPGKTFHAGEFYADLSKTAFMPVAEIEENGDSAPVDAVQQLLCRRITFLDQVAVNLLFKREGAGGNECVCGGGGWREGGRAERPEEKFGGNKFVAHSGRECL